MKATNEEARSSVNQSKYSEEELQALATVSARLERFPFSVEDVYHNRTENVANMTEVFTTNCFNKCQVVTNAPFMTTHEGLCFRNCITKFNSWYPSLKTNLQDAPFRFYEDKIHAQAVKKNDDYAAKSSDPWAEAREMFASRETL